MRISDWSSDVCSSDLPEPEQVQVQRAERQVQDVAVDALGGACRRYRLAVDPREAHRAHRGEGGGAPVRAVHDTVDHAADLDLAVAPDDADRDEAAGDLVALDRKSTRLNSSH